MLFRLPLNIVRLLLPTLFVVSTTALAATTACPEGDAVALSWLDKMSNSIRQATYHGVVTLQRGTEMQVMQVSHSVVDGRSTERLVELTGQGAEIERLAHPLDCLHPGDQLLRKGALLQGHNCGIAQQYRFRLAKGERVAGRQAVRIVIEPRDMYRFGYVMDLDEETGLLLRTQTIGHDRKILETMQFANISYSHEMPEVSQVEVVHEAQHPDPESSSITLPLADEAWHVGWLPLGFTATDSSLGISGRRTYTDGLAVFSVFLEHLNLEIRPGEGLVRRGGTTSYTRGMHIEGRPVLVTVIGEVPVNTARMVADSVKWAH